MLNLKTLQISPLVQRQQANRSIAYLCEKSVGLNTVSPREGSVWACNSSHPIWPCEVYLGANSFCRPIQKRPSWRNPVPLHSRSKKRKKERRKSTTRRRHHRPPPPAAMAMRPLARLRHQLSPSLLRFHGPRNGWPPASDAAFLWRGLASSSPSAAAAAAGREKRSRRTLGYLLGVAVAMVGASYAAVPLYRRFCQATGYGGTVQIREVWTALIFDLVRSSCSVCRCALPIVRILGLGAPFYYWPALIALCNTPSLSPVGFSNI
jgi:hypothetical protein